MEDVSQSSELGERDVLAVCSASREQHWPHRLGTRYSSGVLSSPPELQSARRLQVNSE